MLKKVFDIKIIFLLVIFLFAIPSLYHIINSGFVLNGNEYFNFFINNDNISKNNFISAFIYFIFFFVIFILYFIIIKKRNKLFKSNKNIFLFIIIVSIMFSIILPITSSDIYSYATTGEIQSTYSANPYYDTISKVKNENDTSNNQILNAISIWDNQFVIYGPLWSLICALITFFSFSKISIAIVLFKLLAIIVHCINAYLIYKLFRKKIWVLIYGINPYILFETISNVHNDLYVVFFSLLAFYFFIKKKNIILTMLFLACATCVKYITILFVPIILIYFYRNNSIEKRILNCLKMGLLFGIFVLFFYIIYLRNFEMIFYVLIQQNKYRESIKSLIYIVFAKLNLIHLIKPVSITMSITCIIIYVIFVIKMLFKKNVKFKECFYSFYMILIIFILIIISNMCSWYFVWLFSIIYWQKANNIRIIIYIPLIYELFISYYFYLGSDYALKSYWFSSILICLILILYQFNYSKKRIRNKKLCIKS